MGSTIHATDEPATDPLALHGVAWRQPWAVSAHGETSASLRLDWLGEARWPFPFELMRRFELGPDCLTVAMVIRNLGARPMPAALGFHPYFLSTGSAIQARVGGSWSKSPEGIPVSWSRTRDARRLADGVSAADLHLDDCFTDWNGQAELTWSTHRVKIKASPVLSFLQVYAPVGETYLCLEPQTAMPDALNRDPREGGIKLLQSGEALSAQLELRVDQMG